MPLTSFLSCHTHIAINPLEVKRRSVNSAKKRLQILLSTAETHANILAGLNLIDTMLAVGADDRECWGEDIRVGVRVRIRIIRVARMKNPALHFEHSFAALSSPVTLDMKKKRKKIGRISNCSDYVIERER